MAKADMQWSAQQKWDVHPMLDKCWASVADGGPAIIQRLDERLMFAAGWISDSPLDTRRCCDTTTFTLIQLRSNVVCQVGIDDITAGIISPHAVIAHFRRYSFTSRKLARSRLKLESTVSRGLSWLGVILWKRPTGICLIRKWDIKFLLLFVCSFNIISLSSMSTRKFLRPWSKYL